MEFNLTSTPKTRWSGQHRSNNSGCLLHSNCLLLLLYDDLLFCTNPLSWVDPWVEDHLLPLYIEGRWEVKVGSDAHSTCWARDACWGRWLDLFEGGKDMRFLNLSFKFPSPFWLLRNYGLPLAVGFFQEDFENIPSTSWWNATQKKSFCFGSLVGMIWAEMAEFGSSLCFWCYCSETTRISLLIVTVELEWFEESLTSIMSVLCV